MTEQHTDAALAAAFNAWMDEYVNHPERFSNRTADALKHLRERIDGRELSYGELSAATLKAYLARG